MDARYPPIEPFAQGMLPTGDGHSIYWERCGQRGGVPALFLHGGPGSGASIGQRRFFNPDVYDIVLFDQRGAGRSRPLASAPEIDLSTQTTDHLVADIEALRQHLGIAQPWTILGMSWGTTLALAYAQRYPQHVRAMVLALVTTTSRREVQWITQDVGCLFPEAWHRFASAVPDTLSHLPLVDAYSLLLTDSEEEVCDRAAQAWCQWEDAHVSLTPGHKPSPRFQDPAFRLGFARLVTHYWRHHAFYQGETLVQNASRLAGIHGVLIHGRYDVSSPLETAWKLHRAWPDSELHVLDDAGHGGGQKLLPTIVRALDRFATAARKPPRQ